MSITYSTNFDAASVGSLPAGWASIIGTWSVQAADAVSGANTLAATTRTVGDFAVYTGQAAQAYQKVTVSQKLTDTPNGFNGGDSSNDNYYALCTRVSSGGSAGYLWLLRNSATAGAFDVLLYKITAVNTYVQIGSTLVGAITGLAAGDVVLIEAISNGSTHDLRVWTSTGARPSAATYSASDATTASGHIGFYYSKAAASSASVAGIDDLVYEDNSSGATTITLSGPSSGAVGFASAAFTVGADVGLSGSVTVTPSDSGAGGTFTPASVVISAGTPTATFTYTAASTGTKSISVTNNGGLANPSALTYTAGAAPVVVPVTDGALFFSPFNWYSDGAGAMQANGIRGSSTYAWCNMRGGYLKFKATVGASGSIALGVNTASLAGLTASGCPRLKWSINGGAEQTYLLVSGDTSVSLATGLSAGTYEVFVWFSGVYITQDGGSAQNYTTPNNRLHITGVSLSSGGSVSAVTLKTKRMIVFGDSITEGDLSNGGPRSATSQDALLTYGWYLSQALDAEVGIVGFYGQTWSWLSSSWQNYASGLSRLFTGLLSPAPDFIVINYGENDGNPGPTTGAVNPVLTAIAAAAPAAKIALLIPFSGKARTNLSAATLPANAVRVDLGRYEMLPGSTQWSYDGQHPNHRGHANLGALLARAINAASPGTSTRTVSLTLTGAASLSGLRWTWRDTFTGAILASGVNGSTSGSGLISLSVTTSLSSGQPGWLEVNNSDGTTATDFKGYSGPAQVS